MASDAQFPNKFDAPKAIARSSEIVILRVAGVIGLVLATIALYWALRIAWSDWLAKDRTRESILAAIHLVPDNSYYYRDWAEIVPAEGTIALRQAATVNPLNSSIRIELGASAEEAGNFAEAEESLLKAVALNRTSGPRRLLSEYYFRRREVDKFWPAVRAALGCSDDNAIPQSLFEKCWALSSDSSLILERAIPDSLPVLRGYLDYLLSQNRIEASEPVANRIMTAKSGPEVADSLLNYCDRLLTKGSCSPAVLVWNWLCGRKFVKYDALTPQEGGSLTNGEFAAPPTSRGFDWRFSSVEGMYIEHATQPARISVTFSGQQPERSEVLSQYLPLAAGKSYRLRIHYRTSDIATHSGLICRVLIPGRGDLIEDGGTLPGGSNQELERTFSFVAPEHACLGRLLLAYERVRGTMRIQGTVEIHRVDLWLER